MANASYDNMWRDAMADLNEQLHVEGVDDEPEMGMTKTGTQSSAREVTIFQAFQHFACLYIKYLQIFRKLETCYDSMIHPQKRLHVRKVLELVIKRVIELKHDLVKWNPPNAYVRIPQGTEEPFPWEYVHLDDILVDLKLSPDTLEIPVPKYFREDQLRRLEQRDRLVLGYMRLKHNTDQLFIEDRFSSIIPLENMTLDRAIEIIQRNERGRQGNERALLVKDLREKERQGRMYDASAQIEMDSDIAATNLQRMFRGYLSRNAAVNERENELVFIGMRAREDKVDLLEHELNMAYRKRKQEQTENKESYEQALDHLKEVIVDEEGSEKREELREERTLWVTDQIAQEKFPEDLELFNATKNYIAPVDADGAQGKDDKKKKDDKKAGKGKKEEKGAKGGKGGKGKGKASEEEKDTTQAMPKLQGRTELTESMYKTVLEYEDVWERKEETDNFQQRYDVELAKDVVRPGVYEEIRKQVDAMLVMNLKKIKMQIAPGKDKKKKAKKGKKGKKKGAKDKKRKPLPGEKISELKGLDADHMLSMLIEQQLVVRYRTHSIKELVGDFNYLGSMHHSAERKDEESWTPQDPSMAQIRQSITEYCILPNGSNEIKNGIKPENNVKSVMLFGPSGSGKTLMVETVASELGALLIHLSPEKLKGAYPGKTGATKLVHMVMTVARDPSMQPVVIYIDDCEAFFTGGKKSKGDKDGPSRFKKDLLLYKNLALTQEHRVCIIGTSKQPEFGDQKELRSFFDRFLYLPYPDYSSRLMLWETYLHRQITEAYNIINAEARADHTKPHTASTNADAVSSLVKEAVDSLDLSSLAHISEGYTAGAIARTVRTIITTRRVMMMRTRPLADGDFIDSLAIQEVTYQDDKAAFLSFLRIISGMDERRKRIDSIIAGETGDGKDDKKGKGKGKAKGKGGKK
eukprot:gene4375-8717_t